MSFKGEVSSFQQPPVPQQLEAKNLKLKTRNETLLPNSLPVRVPNSLRPEEDHASLHLYVEGFESSRESLHHRTQRIVRVGEDPLLILQSQHTPREKGHIDIGSEDAGSKNRRVILHAGDEVIQDQSRLGVQSPRQAV